MQPDEDQQPRSTYVHSLSATVHGNAGLGGVGVDAEVGLARSELVGLAIIIVVIACLTIAHHGHHKRESVLIATNGLKVSAMRK